MSKAKNSLIIFVYILFSTFLFILSAFSLFLSTQERIEECPLIIKGNILETILIAAIYAILVLLFSNIVSKNKKMAKWFLVISALWFLWITISFSYSNGYHVSSDQAYVYYGASDVLTNVRGCLNKGGYFYIFPYQLGLMLYEQFVFLINGNIEIINLCIGNAIANTITLVAGYFIVKEISKNEKTSIIYLLFMSTNLSLIIYTVFIYNECISIMFSMLSIWMFIKYMRNKKTSFFVLDIFFLSLACIFRMTSLIVLIAQVCLILVKVLFESKPKLLINAIVLIAITLTSLKAPTYICNKLYDSNISKGTPYILTIAMGMQNDEAPGWYNDYNYSVFHNVTDCDVDASKTIAKQDIRNRLNYFRNNPKNAFDFYLKKFETQWVDEDYQAFRNTRIDNYQKGLIGNLFCYGNSHEFLLNYIDSYQFLIYVLSFVYSIIIIKKIITEKCFDIENSIVAIIIVGGIIFSMLWETKGRYNLQYFIYMIIIAPLALARIESKIIKK